MCQTNPAPGSDDATMKVLKKKKKTKMHIPMKIVYGWLRIFIVEKHKQILPRIADTVPH